MKRSVEITEEVEHDLRRLNDFLIEKSPAAARKANEAISAAMNSLADLSERGRAKGRGKRELVVRFGTYGYIIQYRVDPERVIIARIRHAREQPRP